MYDTIYRQAAIDELKKGRALFCDNTPENFSRLSYGDKCRVDEIDNAIAVLVNMPSAQQEIIRCKDCKYYEIAWLKKDGTDNKRYKPSICVKGKYGITRNPDWFCADAERRTDG